MSLKLKAQLIQVADQQKVNKKVIWSIYRPDERKTKKSNGKLELKFP